MCGSRFTHRAIRMAELESWAFPPELQPRADEVAFDLARALDAVVALRAEIPDEAFTASTLGTERFGNGVVIRDDGLVLTIGYLITEASSVWLTTNAGAAVEAYPLAYDQATGFGLVLPLAPLHAPVLRRGDPASASEGSEVYVLGHGGRAHALKARLLSRREFAGYWEYVLDEALFTAPAHPQWGGTALLDAHGDLIAIGSLLVQESVEGEDVQGNMFVPVDLLEPILDELVRHGRAPGPPRPWLGMYTAELGARLVVNAVADGGPAESAGVLPGDVVVEVADERPEGLADFYRRVWSLGRAGTDVPLVISRRGQLLRVELRSRDRNEFLWRPSLQ
jgi:S1-C subfamily serine protease